MKKYDGSGILAIGGIVAAILQTVGGTWLAAGLTFSGGLATSFASLVMLSANLWVILAQHYSKSAK